MLPVSGSLNKNRLIFASEHFKPNYCFSVTLEWRGMNYLIQLSRAMMYNFILNLPEKPEIWFSQKLICWQATVNSWEGGIGGRSFFLFCRLLFFHRKYPADFHGKLEFWPVKRGQAVYAVEGHVFGFFSLNDLIGRIYHTVILKSVPFSSINFSQQLFTTVNSIKGQWLETLVCP